MGRKVIHLAVVCGLLAGASGAAAHPERPTTMPDYPGAVPEYRTTGPALVVCAEDSEARIEQLPDALRARNRELLATCGHREIQSAVDAAQSGFRILILPGLYREPTSRSRPVDDPRCAEHYQTTTHGDARGTAPTKYRVAGYEYQARCPNARNLIAIVGDLDRDPQHRCDTRCDLQLEGTGDDPSDVVIEGDAHKLDVIHADRADGIYLRNFTVQHAAFNGVNVIETNGFVLERVVARWNQNYGVLTFTGDHGLYDRVTTYGNGHAGVYPGSAADRHHRVPGAAEPPLGRGTTDCTGGHSIEMRGVDSYANTYGYSGTGANAVWVHDSRFHGNATGISTDSTASAHPGMPQDCARFERNEISSNNLDVFDPRTTADCARPYAEREDRRIPCPYFAAPVGTGLQIAGGNDNTVASNTFYDHRQSGVRLFWVPSAVRLNADPTKLYDTSNENRFIANRFGVRPDGRPAPNRVDIWWDEAGVGNCFSANRGLALGAPTSDPPGLQARYPCPRGNPFGFGNPLKVVPAVPCLAYDPRLNPQGLGCAFMRAWRTPGMEP